MLWLHFAHFIVLLRIPRFCIHLTTLLLFFFVSERLIFFRSSSISVIASTSVHLSLIWSGVWMSQWSGRATFWAAQELCLAVTIRGILWRGYCACSYLLRHAGKCSSNVTALITSQQPNLLLLFCHPWVFSYKNCALSWCFGSIVVTLIPRKFEFGLSARVR